MEEKKPVEAKEEKKEEPKAEEKKAEESPPPQEIVLRVYMHCEGCARKVRRGLKGFEGPKNFNRVFLVHFDFFSDHVFRFWFRLPYLGIFFLKEKMIL